MRNRELKLSSVLEAVLMDYAGLPMPIAAQSPCLPGRGCPSVARQGGTCFQVGAADGHKQIHFVQCKATVRGTRKKRYLLNPLVHPKVSPRMIAMRASPEEPVAAYR